MVAIVFFGFCDIFGARQMSRTDAVLQIHSRGILWLHDPARYRSTYLLDKLAAANKALGCGDVALSVTGTNRGFGDLVSVIDRFAPGLRTY